MLTGNLRSDLEDVDDALAAPDHDLQLLVVVGRDIPGVGNLAVRRELVLLAPFPGVGGGSLGQLQTARKRQQEAIRALDGTRTAWLNEMG